MHVALVVNARSGRGRAAAAADELRQCLGSAGFGCRAVGLDAPAELWSGTTSGARAVVAVGGDGTVRSVAARLLGSEVPLAVLPTGTENLAARAFGQPGSPAVLARALAAARTRRVDVGLVRRPGLADHPFLVMASVGFDASVVAALDEVRRGPISHASYVGPILRTARAWRAPRVDAVPREGPAAALQGTGQLVVGNAAAYALRLDPARGADPADGLLDAVLLPADGWMALAAWALRLRCASGAPRGLRRGRSAGWAIRLEPAAPVQADGDLLPGGSAAALEVACLPGALRVVEAG